MATLDQITYEIVDLNRERASILVLYKTAALPAGLSYLIDLPIENGAVPTGTVLHDLIMHHAPVGQLTDAETIYADEQARKALVVGVDLSGIEALLVAPPAGGHNVTLPSSTL